MDLLNNTNTVISIIVGLFGIGGYIVGVVSYLRSKATSSQQKQSLRPIYSYKQSAHQIAPKPLSKLDWMEVLWNGLGDYASAKSWSGCIVPIMVFLLGSAIVSMATFAVAFPNGPVSNGSVSNGSTFLPLILFYVLFFSINLLFYIYFVGRRIEKKIEDINQP